MARMDVPEDRYVSVGQIRTRYWRQGDEGPVVLLVHGIGRFVEDWLLTMAGLSKSARVYAVDLIGHGLSDKPRAPYHADYYAEFLRSFLTAVDVGSAILVGNSFGGGLCMQAAITYPQVCSRLVLLATAGFGRKVVLPLRLITLPGIGECMTRPRSWSPVTAFVGLLHDVGSVPEDLRAHIAERQTSMGALPGAQRAFLRIARANMTYRGVRKRYLTRYKTLAPTLSVPTLIVWGDRDRVIAVDQARVGHQILPDSRLEILPGCGHLPQLERADEVNRLIMEFIEQ